MGWLLVCGAWLVGTFGGGWVLAWWVRRLHPGLAFYKLWAFFAALLNGVAGVVFAFGVVRF